jgi:pilus assembly protein FimV
MISGMTLPAFGLGLGEIRVRSSLGQALLAQADIVGDDAENVSTSCLRARILTMDGVFLASANIVVHQNQKKRALSFSTKQAINEPAINLVIDINCETQLHREFSILLDPPEFTSRAPALIGAESAIVNTTTPGKTPSLSGSEGSSVVPAKSVTPKKRKNRNVEAELVPDYPSPSSQASQLKASVQNEKQSKKSGAKDVLKLSDDVLVSTLQQGLRMSDVLSTEAGKELVENIEELKAAQAKMATILRDEPAGSNITARPDESKEIVNLKQQAEQLKKQNLLDKAALTQLQKKPTFDSWLIILAIVAIVAILIILFLLLYIRRNLTGNTPTWWEDESLESEVAPPQKIEDAIKNFQAKYEVSGSVQDEGSTSVDKQRSFATTNTPESDPFADSNITKPVVGQNSVQRTPSLEETNSSIFNFFTPRGSSVKVEEISDVTQEAEFWISMNDPQRAIEILSAQEKIEQPDSPVPWLFLLDLYRVVKDKDKHDQLRERFIVFFNANIPEYDADLSQVVERHLEDFPHLINRICEIWAGQEIIAYLESLLIDDREGKRAGFDLPVYRDILMLLGIAHELDRIMAIEGPVKDSRLTEVPRVDIELEIDPVLETDFGTIEFETIDFPKMDVPKKQK